MVEKLPLLTLDILIQHQRTLKTQIAKTKSIIEITDDKDLEDKSVLIALIEILVFGMKQLHIEFVAKAFEKRKLNLKDIDKINLHSQCEEEKFERNTRINELENKVHKLEK